MVRFTVLVEPLETKSGWSVQVLHDGAPILDPPRRMRRRGAGLLPFPQPPLAEAEAIAQGASHKELCITTDGSILDAVYNDLLDRVNPDRAVERFGRYLFACLFGDEVWDVIFKLAAGGPLGLAITR